MQNTATWNRQAHWCQIPLKNNINGTLHQYQGFEAHCINKLIPDQLSVNATMMCGVVVEKQTTEKIFVKKNVRKFNPT